jgi:hypothetical protein
MSDLIGRRGVLGIAASLVAALLLAGVFLILPKSSSSSPGPPSTIGEFDVPVDELARRGIQLEHLPLSYQPKVAREQAEKVAHELPSVNIRDTALVNVRFNGTSRPAWAFVVTSDEHFLPGPATDVKFMVQFVDANSGEPFLFFAQSAGGGERDLDVPTPLRLSPSQPLH